MRMWIGAALGVLTALIAGAAAYVLASALRSEHPVGFQTVTVDDPNGAPLQVGVWYPTTSTTWPTVTGLLVQFVAHKVLQHPAKS